MKFDVVVTNPPFKQGLHIEFLKQAAEIADWIVSVQPGDWLVVKREITKTAHLRKKYVKLRQQLTPRVRSVRFIPNVWEDISLWMPLAIVVAGPDETEEIIFDDDRLEFAGYKLNEGWLTGDRPQQRLKHLDHVNMWGGGEIEHSIVQRVYSHAERWKPHVDKRRGDFFISLDVIMGPPIRQKDLQLVTFLDGVTRNIAANWSVIRHDRPVLSEPARSRPFTRGQEGNIKPFVSFTTEYEAQNALDFLVRTKFMRAWLAIIKTGKHAASLNGCIPWLDWAEPWPDERINVFFGFTPEEVAWIDRVVEEICI